MHRIPNDKATRLQYRQLYIPTGARLIPGPAGCAAYGYETAGKSYAIVFRGTAAKPEFHHSYRTAELRDAHVKAFFDGIVKSHAYKDSRKAEHAAWKNPLKGGEILYASWGYDQTNVDFFAVTRVSGRRVWVRKIYADQEETGFMSGKTWPAMPIRYYECKQVREQGDAWSRLLNGEETMHIAQPSGTDGVSIKISDSIYAWLEQGREHHNSWYA